jgi:single-strand DNA-binding protein
MNEIPFYAAANLTRDPELRTTADGKSVARLSLAVTPRRREQGAWVDGTTTFLDATVWADQAENVAKSLHKGDRVIVIGRVETRIYTPTQGTNAGQEVRKLEVLVDEVGPSLRWAEANVQRVAGQRSDEPAVSEEAPL